MVDFKNLMC